MCCGRNGGKGQREIYFERLTVVVSSCSVGVKVGVGEKCEVGVFEEDE
jgi:hypothetical protein